MSEMIWKTWVTISIVIITYAVIYLKNKVDKKHL